MCNVWRKAGERSKSADVLLVNVSRYIKEIHHLLRLVSAMWFCDYRLKKAAYFIFWAVFAMLLWLAFCSEIILALEDFDGDLVFFLKENQNIDALLAMRSLDVSRCAGQICKTNEKHIKSMPAVWVFATLLEHVDSAVLATYDLR